MAESNGMAEQRAAEEREQQQLEQFLAHAACNPELQARLKGVDPYEVVETAAVEGFQLGVFTLHRLRHVHGAPVEAHPIDLTVMAGRPVMAAAGVRWCSHHWARVDRLT
jgi:hypothetical protein